MRSFIRVGLALVFAFQIFSAAGFAGESGDTIPVVATGIGKDSKAALTNALRQAVEQAVGSLVDAETLVDNAEVMSDRILSHSSGYVESHEQLGEPKTVDGGLVSVQIRAKVRPMQLNEGLRKMGIRVKDTNGIFQQPFDGKQLFGAALTKSEVAASANQMIQNARERASENSDTLEEILKGYPENYLKARMVGKPKYDEKTAKLSIDVEISLDMEKQMKFFENLDGFLRNTYGRGETVNMEAYRSESEVKLTFPHSKYYMDRRAIAICKTWPSMKRGEQATTTWRYYDVDTTVTKIALSSLFDRVILHIDLTDKDNDVVSSKKLFIPAGIGYSSSIIYFFPALFSIYGPYDTHFSYESFYFGNVRPGTQSCQFNVNYDISAEDLPDIANVLMRFEGQNK